MAVSLHNLLKERKYPFIFSLFLLLIVVTILFLNNSESPSVKFTTELARSLSNPQLYPSTSPSSILTTSPPLIISNPITPAPSVPPPRQEIVATKNTAVAPVETDRVASIDWKMCQGSVGTDFIPCLDNIKAIKGLKSIRRKEHRERHCPEGSAPRCLIPLPQRYKVPVSWPKSRDMIWFDNVPHPKLVEYKKDQNWVRLSGDYLVFPGGGTQFKDGVAHYIRFIEKTLPAIKWGKHTRVVLDVGCGVASFGGYLLDKGVITMSFAPKDEHEAQIQLALERGIPSIISIIGTQRLTFPDNTYDLIHCARCRVHWHGDGGKPLVELNRILRPGGFFVWSATPVYRQDERHLNIWKTILALSESICWTVAAKTTDSSGVGLVMFQKPVSPSCYKKRKENNPPLCDQNYRMNTSWYTPLDGCLPPLPSASWPQPWPKRLRSKPASLPTEPDAEQIFNEDTKDWSALVIDVYMGGLNINWSTVRNVMDMNAGFGGFATALVDLPLWVMNVMPINGPDTLSVIYDRGLIGIYHDWCESFSTYPRTFDLLHSSFLFGNLTKRCDIIDIAVEIDRILRPDGILLVQDTVEMLNKLSPILRSLHWSVNIYQEQFLVGNKGFWRPGGKMRI